MRFDLKTLTCGCVVAVCVLAAPLSVQSDGSATDIRKKIHSASAAQTNDLYRREQRFYALSREEQDRLRKLHAQIEKHPQSARLLETLRRYNEWLKTLDPVQQAELQGLAPGDRIEKIKELRQRDDQRLYPIFNNKRLSESDMRAIVGWLERFIVSHQDEILAALPTPAKTQIRNADPRQRRFMLRSAYMRGIERRDVPIPGPDEIAELKEMVSDEAREILDRPESKQKILKWFAETGSLKRVPRVDDDQLRKFYQDDLTEEQRQQVDNMSVDERKFKLRQMYFQHQRATRDDSNVKFPRNPDGKRPSARRGSGN